jgi:Ca2+-binding RTX toxin-like protein
MARIYSVNSSYRVDTRAILTDQAQNDSNEILRATLREDEFFRQVAFTERGFFIYTYRDYMEVNYSDRTILKLYGEFDDGFDLPVGMLRGYSHFSQSLDLLFVEGFELPFSILDSGIEELIHTKMFEANDEFYLSKYDDYADSFSGNDIVYGQLGNDTLLGGDGNDYLYGGFGPYRGAWIFVWGREIYENLNSGDDLIYGQNGNDFIFGENGNDYLEGGSGNDHIDGGSGIDTAGFTGALSEYLFSGTGSSVVVTDRVLGRDGTDNISEVEFLRFSDQTISTSLLPTYALAISMVNVNEGSTAIFILTTTNVVAGTQVAYMLSGISAADIQGGSLSGTTIVGSNGQATISVALLADNLTEGAETLTITAAGKTASTIVNDTSPSLFANFTGTSGNDIFRISSGSNSIDGGAGSDTVQYQTARSAASVTSSNGSITVSKANGTDTITGVERIEFTDGDLVFDVASSNAPAAYRLYGGAFDRTPDEGGFRYWTQTFDNGASLHDVAASFIDSPEFITRYGTTLSNAAFVDALYQNVLDRAGEAGGVAHWNRMLDNKYQDRADVLVEFTQLPEFVGISAADIANGYWVV